MLAFALLRINNVVVRHVEEKVFQTTNATNFASINFLEAWGNFWPGGLAVLAKPCLSAAEAIRTGLTGWLLLKGTG